jgi:hypothetical protein
MTKLTTRQADKLIEAAQNAVTFSVVGHGEFPADMLRYDLCWPASHGDSALLGYSTGTRRIELKGLKLPTAARWESFGWKLVQA